MCLNSRQVSLSFHKCGKRRSERLGDVPMVTREACCAPETEHRSIGSFGMQSVLGTLQESTASLPMDALFPALPTLPHPHLEAQNFRKKLKCKKYATSYSWFCFCFLNTFFFFSFLCLYTHFVLQFHPKYPGLCSRLISVFWGLFSFDKMLLAVLYLLLYVLPPSRI